MNWLDRRRFLVGSAAALAAGRARRGRRPCRRKIAEAVGADRRFAIGFDLGKAPPLAIERAQTAFVDTLGVTLAGSTEKVAEIVRDMVRAEAAGPVASVIGASFKTSPQLAALANGVAAHAMDYDFTYLSGQAVSPLIPAILPVAERPARRLRRCWRPSSSASRSARGSPAPTRPTTAPAPGTAPAPSARSRRRFPARG
jgi:hypothetical protein